MVLEQFFIDGLGCASYLVGCEGAGVAAVIDPDRQVEKYITAAEKRGLKITHIIETHLHADHVSGNTDLAQRTGADIYLHEDANAQFPHQKLVAGDHIEIGNVVLQVIHTPGHTPESITIAIIDRTRADEPWLALTGDTLFVGDMGRPDLTGAGAARQLAGQMYDSLFTELAPLTDAVMIYPGHGAGSLCGKSIGAMRSTTLGYERRFNPALAPRERADFVEFAISDLPEQPGNHQRIKSVNRQGPRPLGKVELRPLNVQQALPYFQRGAALLDTRSKADYVGRHVPGSVHLENDDQLSNRVGFVLHPDYPVVLLLADEHEYHEIVYKLARIGYENVVGFLAGGLDEWERYGLPVTSGDIEDIGAPDLHKLMLNGNGNRPLILDVREPWEYQRGHLPGARLIPLGQLAQRIGELNPDQPVAVVCQTGNRSQSAAAVLGQKNFKKVYNLLGGTSDWARRGLPLEN